MREICAADLLANPIAIGGPNTTVEMDDSLFSRRKNHQGRQLPQQCVFGGIYRETRECFMYTVPDRSAATLLPIIQGSIRPGTTIMSDLWAAYGGIQAMGYTHLTVNHTNARVCCLVSHTSTACDFKNRMAKSHVRVINFELLYLFHLAPDKTV